MIVMGDVNHLYLYHYHYRVIYLDQFAGYDVRVQLRAPVIITYGLVTTMNNLHIWNTEIYYTKQNMKVHITI